MKKYFLYLKNYEKLRNKRLSKHNIFKLLAKVLFEIFITKVFQFFKLNKLLLSLIQKYDLIYSIRHINLENKLYLAKNWKKYNQFNLNNEDNKIANEFDQNGFYNFGKVFSDEDCKNFIKTLDNQDFYNSQQPLQSDGEKNKFCLKINNYNFNYFCFLPEAFFFNKNIQQFLKNNQTLFRDILGFEYQVYSALTWINLPSKKKHYVQYPHRDYDDYKFLTIIINWTDLTKNNGATLYYKGSHKNNDLSNEIYLEGKRGTVFIADNYGVHSGSLPTDNQRISTWIRLGKINNPASIQDGFATTPIL